jgi:hypothetical protein
MENLAIPGMYVIPRAVSRHARLIRVLLEDVCRMRLIDASRSVFKRTSGEGQKSAKTGNQGREKVGIEKIIFLNRSGRVDEIGSSIAGRSARQHI